MGMKPTELAMDTACPFLVTVPLDLRSLPDCWTAETRRDGRVEDGRGSLGHAATLRFPSPLIEPDVRISRIRLSDWLHREAHGASDQGKRSRRNTPRSP